MIHTGQPPGITMGTGSKEQIWRGQEEPGPGSGPGAGMEDLDSRGFWFVDWLGREQ